MRDMQECIARLFCEPQLFYCCIAIGDDIFEDRIERPIFFKDQVFDPDRRFIRSFCDKSDPFSCLGFVLPLTDLFPALVLVDIF
jgi:hypothetical protein